MFWAILAALAQLAAPAPTNNWLTAGDTPAELGRRSVLVRLRLTVMPSGHVQACDIEESTGIAIVDRYTCRLALRRATFSPAVSASGVSTYGVYRAALLWNGSPQHPMIEGDVVASLSSLPNDAHSPIFVPVTMEVDTAGTVAACVPQPPKEHAADALMSLACEQIRNTYKATPAKSETGVAVTSVQNAVVEFTTN